MEGFAAAARCLSSSAPRRRRGAVDARQQLGSGRGVLAYAARGDLHSPIRFYFHGILVRQARLSQTQSLNIYVSRDRYSLDSYTAVTGVRSAQSGDCFSRNGAKQVTRSIPPVTTLLWPQQDTSRYLVICTDCRARIPLRMSATGQHERSLRQVLRRNHLLSCIRNKTSRPVFIKKLINSLIPRSTREGELERAGGPTARPTNV
jgi:hypothetical protein